MLSRSGTFEILLQFFSLLRCLFSHCSHSSATCMILADKCMASASPPAQPLAVVHLHSASTPWHTPNDIASTLPTLTQELPQRITPSCCCWVVGGYGGPAKGSTTYVYIALWRQMDGCVQSRVRVQEKENAMKWQKPRHPGFPCGPPPWY
jgi:hypothetical protein